MADFIAPTPFSVRRGLRRALFIVQLFAFGFSVCAAPVRIVVAGDGRAGGGNRAEDRDGLNEVINREIVQAVLDEQAEALLWTGDLVNVTNRSKSAFKRGLLAWRSIYQPLYDRKVTVLPTRGNHELPCRGAAKIWNRVFSGQYALPANGPRGSKNLSFYFVLNSVVVIGLDEYATGDETIDEAWFEDVLAQHTNAMIFVYGHEPAFMAGRHKDTLDSHPDRRDAMWRAMMRAGARVYFCGHDHFYDHMLVTSTDPDQPLEVHQFTAGTAGAPFYTGGPYAGKNTGWKLTRASHIENTYGYILLEVQDDRARITFKGRTAPGKYEPMDTVEIVR